MSNSFSLIINKTFDSLTSKSVFLHSLALLKSAKEPVDLICSNGFSEEKLENTQCSKNGFIQWVIISNRSIDKFVVQHLKWVT